MKTSEFIRKFNEAGRPDYSAQRKDNGDDRNLVINHVDYRGKSMITATTKACLIEGNTVWDIDGGLFSAKMLELMAELAKTPPEEREEQPKYVILNGLPRHGKCCYFAISREGQLITSQVDGAGIEKYAAYSQEKLVESKKYLTQELAAAVDMMAVTLERAIELTEQSKHDDLD